MRLFIVLTSVKPVLATTTACVDLFSKRDKAELLGNSNKFVFKFSSGNAITILDQHGLATGEQRQIMAESVNDVWRKYSNSKLEIDILVASYFVDGVGDRMWHWADYHPEVKQIRIAMNTYYESFVINAPDSVKMMFVMAHEAKHLVQDLVHGEKLISSERNSNYSNDLHEIDANREAMDYIKGKFPFASGSITLVGNEYPIPSASSYKVKPYSEKR